MIPLYLRFEVARLRNSVVAAKPLSQATTLLKGALNTYGIGLIADIETEMARAETPLDADDPTGIAGDFVDGLLALSVAADDTTDLADMRGLVGREVFNVAQA